MNAEAHILNMAEFKINDAAVKETFLTDLAQALICDDIEAKVPDNPAINRAEKADSKEDKPDTEHLIIIRPDERWHNTKRS